MDDHIQDKISQLYGEIGEWIEECDRLKAGLYDANEEIVRLKDMETRLGMAVTAAARLKSWASVAAHNKRHSELAMAELGRIVLDLDAALDEGADDE